MGECSFEKFVLEQLSDENHDFNAPPYPPTVEEEPEISEAAEKELLSKRIRPVFTTKRYRKVVVRNASSGEFEVAYMPKRKKTWTARSEAGFKKACKVRAQNCKQRKALRVQDQITKLQSQLQELAEATQEQEEEEEEDEDSDVSHEEAPSCEKVTIAYTSPPTKASVHGGKSIELPSSMLAPGAPSKRKTSTYIDKKAKKVKKD